MSDGGVWWSNAGEENIGTLRERFNVLEKSPYASSRMTMANDSVSMVAEKAPSIFAAIICIGIGIIVPRLANSQYGPLEGFDFLFLGAVMVVFIGVGVLLLRRHLRGAKWLFIHETHLELRYEKSDKGIPEEYKHILHSDVVKIISHERITESTDQDGSTTTYVSHVTSILVYNKGEPESRTDHELCLCVADIPSSTKEESDAIAAALNFLILATPPQSSVE